MTDREARDAEIAWIQRTLDLTIRSLGALAETATSAAGMEAVGAIRDLSDHAAIWAERLDALRGGTDRFQEHPRAARDADRIAFEALRGRIASGLAARLEATDAPLGPDTRRAALCCVPDLERHARRAAAELFLAGRRGLSGRIREVRDGLPSPREFLQAPFARRRPVHAPVAETSHPCPPVPRRASFKA